MVANRRYEFSMGLLIEPSKSNACVLFCRYFIASRTSRSDAPLLWKSGSMA